MATTESAGAPALVPRHHAPTTASQCVTSPGSGHEESSREVLRLASADNFRDVAGPGYATLDGRQVKRGVFYRSNDLLITDDEATTLTDLGLRAVLDLRTEPEIERHRDRQIDGATWHHFDVSGIPLEEIWGLGTREEAVEMMHRVYASFVEERHSLEKFGGLFRQLATGGPQLFHCSAGKDRTGWVATLLLHIADVDDATIESDYLLTNALTAGSRGRVEDEIAESRGKELVHILEPALVANVDYLHTGWAAAEKKYGDRTSYLLDGMGLDSATLDRLRELLVAPRLSG
jgi:protein-tyrosine phosphatase